MQDVLCLMLCISCKCGLNLCREKKYFFPNKRQIHLPSKSKEYCFPIYSSQTFDMKIKKVSLVKKLGLLYQRDKQVVRDNVQQNLFRLKFCSF